jgi:hypothetical protein
MTMKAKVFTVHVMNTFGGSGGIAPSNPFFRIRWK